MEVLQPHRLTPALLLWPRRMPSINVDVSFYVPASNAPTLYKQASASHFLPQALIFHSPPPPPAYHHYSNG
jgi:proteasome lid subunit RPN8/RPN11